MSYIEEILDLVKRRNPAEYEFHQAVDEVLQSLEPVLEKHPEYREARILERLVEPERAHRAQRRRGHQRIDPDGLAVHEVRPAHPIRELGLTQEETRGVGVARPPKHDARTEVLGRDLRDLRDVLEFRRRIR